MSFSPITNACVEHHLQSALDLHQGSPNELLTILQKMISDKDHELGPNQNGPEELRLSYQPHKTAEVSTDPSRPETPIPQSVSLPVPPHLRIQRTPHQRSKSWAEDLEKSLRDLFSPRESFSLGTLYEHLEVKFQKIYPENNHIRDTFRACLQNLCKQGVVTRVKRGLYRLI